MGRDDGPAQLGMSQFSSLTPWNWKIVAAMLRQDRFGTDGRT